MPAPLCDRLQGDRRKGTVGQNRSAVSGSFRIGYRMFSAARALRSLANLRFRILNLATIQEVSAETFEPVFKQLVSSGWKVRSRYAGFDAGVDYDCLCLRKGFATLKCEWDNWSEWSIEGKRHLIEEIADRSKLPITYAWRWADALHRKTSPPAELKH
ncbi:hypothetical protein [Rhizobacter sp. Root1238]|nr:hypothetical protein [Rhizobacter sp. Root1238]